MRGKQADSAKTLNDDKRGNYCEFEGENDEQTP